MNLIDKIVFKIVNWILDHFALTMGMVGVGIIILILIMIT
jgi:hypothetical protein